MARSRAPYYAFSHGAEAYRYPPWGLIVYGHSGWDLVLAAYQVHSKNGDNTCSSHDSWRARSDYLEGEPGSVLFKAAYDIFNPPGPKVGWSSLFLGPFKIPRHQFILWLAILGRLSTLDKPWLHHLGGSCVLCQDGTLESHDHLFFMCRCARNCLKEIRKVVHFHWPNRAWEDDIQWASIRWTGKHIVNASYRALLALFVYHLWQERNRRIFQHTTSTYSAVAHCIVSDIRFLILSRGLPNTVSTRGLYRLWRIPWPVEGNAST
ncbi:UNVERIFIED_CONTAM: hypothetical protein Slati_2777800 [Sesamum latifolium]|uniref:Reverse transcriptase zinc-binding domain-containing protein n=1 Tax=Sesamum latifolium TaxID=2727402 RepID=A0AAW2W004_9LAMI